MYFILGVLYSYYCWVLSGLYKNLYVLINLTTVVITLVFALLGYSVIPYNQSITISEGDLWIVGLVLIWSVNSLFKSTNDFLDLSCSFFRYFFVVFIFLAVSANFSIYESGYFLSSPVYYLHLDRIHTITIKLEISKWAMMSLLNGYLDLLMPYPDTS